jgi:1-pyrroline-5-carboxylate dehydrogenase
VVHKSAEIKNAVLQTVRGAFEYQGQKCSALSRLYVSASLWKSGFKDQFLEEIAKIRVGPPQDFGNFLGPVMCVGIGVVVFSVVNCSPSGKPAFDKIIGYIQKAKEAGGEVLIGGNGALPTVLRFDIDSIISPSGDDSKGYFVQPTVILTKDPRSVTMSEEIFGPVVTVRCIICLRAYLRADEWGLTGLRVRRRRF